MEIRDYWQFPLKKKEGWLDKLCKNICVDFGKYAVFPNR